MKRTLLMTAAVLSLQGCAMYSQALVQSRTYESRLQSAEIENEKLQRLVRENIKRSGL